MTTTRMICPFCTAISPEIPADPKGRMCLCTACGAWVVWPRPTVEAINAHYAGGDRGLPPQLRSWREGTAQHATYDRIAAKLRMLGGGAVSSAVDVGAGGLELTRALARVLPDAEVEAWDLFADEREAHRGEGVEGRVTLRTVDLNRLDAASVAGRRFDLVACVAVIEHVLEPLSLLRLLRSISAPGGVVYVAGPDVGSLARRVMRSRWPYYSPDDHLTIPTFASVRSAVAIAGGGGFELRPLSVPYSLRYLLRFLHLPLRLPDAADVILPIPSGAFELIWRPHAR